MNAVMTSVRVGDIKSDGGTQMRAGLDAEMVREFAEVMVTQGWGSFPPVTVYYDGASYWLADGFHRLAAYRSLVAVSDTSIPAEIFSGTRRDAILHAAGANASHGLRRTNADKRRAVETLLRDEEWVKWSDAEISRRCNVDPKTVGNIRRELSASMEIPEIQTGRTVTRGNTTYQQNTANIGARAAASDPEPLPAWVTQSSVTAAVIEEDEEPEPVRHVTVTDEYGAQETYRLEEGEELTIVRSELTPAPLPVRPPRPTREPEPTPAALPDAVAIHHADARTLASLGIDPVHLVITSPPYNVGIDYATHDDNMTEDDYHDLLFDVFGQCWQVMEDGARIAVIVPFGVGRNPWIPVPPTIYTLLKAAGFTLRGQIIWDKNTTGNRTSWGSFRLSSNPAIRDTTEAIIVAHKGSGNLVVPDTMRGVDGKGTYTAALADSDYFMELAQDHWVVAPESAQRVGHPAPFPVELAKRLIDFYAYPGAHILDPFGGSGSTGIAALNAGCRATLVEIDSEYCRLAKGRLSK